MTAVPDREQPQSLPLPLSPDWANQDQRLLWHPYAATGPSPAALAAVQSAQGCTLTLADGRQVVDGMASWWCAIHGYNHPRLNEAINTQLTQMAHVMFGGLTHAPAIELAKRLAEITPDGLERVFLADSGSVAVEVALKMAMQFQHARGDTQRRKLLTVRGGYYGDTTGAMSLCDPDTGMHGHFQGAILKQIFAGPPPVHDDQLDQEMAALAALLDAQGDRCAALILEPLVQGAGGMRFYPAAYVNRICALARDYGLLVIFDEIATGFGRTGTLFALEQTQVVPDILCLGKALTGGYMTMAAVLAGPHIAATIESAAPGVFMHGPTFMANPLAASVACASIDLLLESPWQQRVADIGAQLSRELEPLRDHPGIADVRVRGAIGVVETEQAVDVRRLCVFFLEQGCWIRPFGKLIYLMPPYVISPQQLSQLTASIITAVTRNEGMLSPSR